LVRISWGKLGGQQLYVCPDLRQTFKNVSKYFYLALSKHSTLIALD